MASVVANPPAESVVAGFFVVDRLSDRSDSRGYVEALASQLSEIAHVARPASPTPEDLQPLLELAAARLRSSGLTLLLVADALDEDQGNRPGSGRPSIASVLPAELPPGVTSSSPRGSIHRCPGTCRTIIRSASWAGGC